MKGPIRSFTLLSIFFCAFAVVGSAQSVTRELRLGEGRTITVINLTGRVEVVEKLDAATVGVTASSADGVAENELKIDSGNSLAIEAAPTGGAKRIDISLTVPERVRLKIETAEGEIRVSGNFESVEAKTSTGTIAADVPTKDLKYDFFWTASRPRFLSDIELTEVKEKSGGKFQLKGEFVGDAESGRRGDAETAGTAEPEAEATGAGDSKDNSNDQARKDQEKKDRKKDKARSQQGVSLKFSTARGIVLLNIPPNEVTSDLRERPLTDAAKAIVRSGDIVLMDAIRRASPKHFGEYARTLPPVKREPYLAERATRRDVPGETIKEAIVRVTDTANRAIPNLKASDFAVVEVGSPREVISVRAHTAPVNLVLLLDVSGSVDNYVNFIRKAARAFLDTARPEDRISLILFNEDVKVLSGFSTNRRQLSESLDTFDAGGATAYYDSIAYTLAEVLRPLRGERTAIVVLTDGDDNRSFLPFDSLAGAIAESGALIYPLYVPSALIASSASNDPDKAIDPLRSRYMTLSARAEGEGEKLAKISGGVYYPITQLSQIQTAYDEIVAQIRTAYTITFRSGFQADPDNRPSPRLRIRVDKPNAIVQINTVTPVRH